MILNAINVLPLFTIVLFRTASVLFFSPLFNQTSLPAMVKIGLALVVAFAIFPVINSSPLIIPDNLIHFIILIFKEIAIGFVIGYGATLTFGAFVVAGELISSEMGLQMAQMADPLFGGQINPIAQLLQMVALLLFLSINGHHWIIESLLLSYKTVPITEFLDPTITTARILHLFQGLFISAIKIAAPIMIILSIVVVVVGLVGKAAPQINIFLMIFPAKIIIGFLLLALTFPFIVRGIVYLLNILHKDLLNLVGGM
jgi:flagellar biosynthetic protein FliR